MTIDAPTTLHAGQLVARRLKASGIDTMFTLSGGHLFPFTTAAAARASG
jgi:acetolactate synthase-1/2/3 large subunit